MSNRQRTLPAHADGAPVPAARHDGEVKEASSAANGKSKGKRVGAALNVVAILRYLGRQGSPVRLVQIARDLEINPSTCLSILHTLAREDFVTIDHDTKRYEIGLSVFELANHSSALRRDITAVRPLLERVANRLGVTVAMWRQISADQKMLVLAATGPGQTRIHLALGQRPPLLYGSGGRVFAAFGNFDERTLRSQFRHIRSDRRLSFREFMTQVQETRDRGWSADIGSHISGIAAVGVPVFDAHGALLMACTAIMWIEQYNERFAQDLANELMRLSRSVTFLSPSL
jgi:DNA-binding IclR family transcriptional regulator